MCVEQLALKVAFPELCFRELDASQHCTGTRARNDRCHLVWYIIVICFRHHWKLLKDIVYELRCDDDFDLSALYRLWARIYKLAGTATSLTLCCCLCKQEVLRIPTGAVGCKRSARWPTRDSKAIHAPLSPPRIPPL